MYKRQSVSRALFCVIGFLCLHKTTHFTQSSWVILSRASRPSCLILANRKVIFFFATYRLTWTRISSTGLYWEYVGGRTTAFPISFPRWSNSYVFLAVRISYLERNSSLVSAGENEIPFLCSHSMISTLCQVEHSGLSICANIIHHDDRPFFQGTQHTNKSGLKNFSIHFCMVVRFSWMLTATKDRFGTCYETCTCGSSMRCV